MLVTGYAKTGKDTFFQDLKQKTIRFQVDGDKKKATWHVFAKNAHFADMLQQFEQVELFRCAFADALKNVTHNYLGIECPTHAFEKVKDSCLFVDPKDPTQLRTMRGWYIHLATQKRMEDPLFWANYVYNIPVPEHHARIITDWRMKNEYKQGYLTLRLFRSDVPNPSFPSEHELDSWLTDFLLVPWQDTETVLKQFPQYHSYCLIGMYAHNV
jgi:hypothetical protein